MSDMTTLRGLLEHHVKMMRLKPDAAWPSEIESTKDMIKAWQRSQERVRPHLVGPDDCDGSHHADSDDFSVSMGA